MKLCVNVWGEKDTLMCKVREREEKCMYVRQSWILIQMAWYEWTEMITFKAKRAKREREEKINTWTCICFKIFWIIFSLTLFLLDNSFKNKLELFLHAKYSLFINWLISNFLRTYLKKVNNAIFSTKKIADH